MCAMGARSEGQSPTIDTKELCKMERKGAEALAHSRYPSGSNRKINETSCAEWPRLHPIHAGSSRSSKVSKRRRKGGNTLADAFAIRSTRCFGSPWKA